MGTEVIQLPDVGAEQVDVIELSVAVGDMVEVEQTLIVVESDKATVDVPSPKAGRVKAISVAVGDHVSLGDSIIELEESSGSDNQNEKSDTSQAQDLNHTNDSAIPQMDEAQVPASKTDQSASESGSVKTVLMTIPDLGIDGGAECIDLVVSVGDRVNAEDTVLTLESDKATLDIPAPFSGQVKAVYASVGQVLKQGDKVADVEIAAVNKSDSSTAQQVESEDTVPGTQPDSVLEPSSGSSQSLSLSSGSISAGAETALKEDQSRVHAGPSVRKLARKLGLSLVGVKGTGPKGRATKDDVLAFAKAKLLAPSPSVSASNIGVLSGATEESIAAFGSVSAQPITKIQHVSAKNLSQSWQTIPHVTQFDEANVTELEAYRKQVGPPLKEQGIRLTMLAFVLKAVGNALKTFPKVNSVLKSGWKELILREYCHIAFAVDTPDGLVVPVVRDVWEKSVAELAQEIVEMSVKARDKKLTPRDYQGASFTISSLGGIGGTAFTPIVNPPQVAILGLSRSEIKPIWNGDEFEPQLMLPMSLSYDHRVIDGADAVRFTRELARLLGDIRNLLL